MLRRIADKARFVKDLINIKPAWIFIGSYPLRFHFMTVRC